MAQKYKMTMYACYTGYITQAIVNNLAPLLFIVFRTKYHIGFERLGRLVLFNFIFQIIIDLIAIKVVEKAGYRASALIANLSSTAGLVLMSVLPRLIDPYTGLVIAISVYAIGGGFFEVIVSPIVENLPDERKQSNMALLHSFYCWGQAAVVVFSTLLLRLTGTDNWTYIPVIWALIPFMNFFLFIKVPIVNPPEDNYASGIKKLFRSGGFTVFCLMMLCAGASELVMSQWASLFAEKGLGLTKSTGDLTGPFLFAILMGTGRVLFAWFGRKRSINIGKAISFYAVLCIVCYVTAALSPFPVISLAACALCGFSVSIMWPGLFSMSAKRFPAGGTAMFAVLAIFGDLGCGLSPWFTGLVSDIVASGSGDEVGIRAGLLAAAVFPVLLLIASFKKIKE